MQRENRGGNFHSGLSHPHGSTHGESPDVAAQRQSYLTSAGRWASRKRRINTSRGAGSGICAQPVAVVGTFGDRNRFLSYNAIDDPVGAELDLTGGRSAV